MYYQKIHFEELWRCFKWCTTRPHWISVQDGDNFKNWQGETLKKQRIRKFIGFFLLDYCLYIFWFFIAVINQFTSIHFSAVSRFPAFPPNKLYPSVVSQNVFIALLVLSFILVVSIFQYNWLSCWIIVQLCYYWSDLLLLRASHVILFGSVLTIVLLRAWTHFFMFFLFLLLFCFQLWFQ